MKTIGITGGVGAGKSTVLRYLEEKWHARVVLTDLVGHLVMEPGTEGHRRIVEIFGEDVLLEDRTIDRKKLGNIVFHDKAMLEKLNGIVHPAVKEYVLQKRKEAEQCNLDYFVIESALLFDDDYNAICDEVWYIYASEEVRIQRIQKERGYTMERIQGIFKNQKSDSWFREKCDYTITNDGDFESTCHQIDERIKTL